MDGTSLASFPYNFELHVEACRLNTVAWWAW